MLSFSSIQAQNEAAIWYFGFNAGLDFNSGAPVALTNGMLSTNEGCSTISNSNGQLLFYTDGIRVWDKSHNVMPNGTGLFGNPSSTQSGIIVPKPNNPNLYYIFTVDVEAGPNGLRYSEVDLTLNGGNGDVNANKNILLTTPTAEKISAIEHTNGNDIWVITHEWNSNNFFAYLVTPAGVNTTPITSTVGAFHGGGNTSNAIGNLKFSPNGERLALAQAYEPNFVEVFDFDTATGLVSNPIFINGIFTENGSDGPYGVEFSPDSNTLYVSDANYSGNSKIHQFNITLSNATDVINSDTILFEGSGTFAGLQLAIDGKIYMSKVDKTFLSVIENPDILGTGANYIDEAVSLNGRSARFGLPPFIQSFFSAGIVVENTCLGAATNFYVNTSNTIDSILWNFGDGNTSTLENPTHNYANTGQYNVNVTTTSGADTITQDRVVTISDVPFANAVSDYILCDDTSNDSIEVFNLQSKNIEILGFQSVTQFNVSYFPTALDAVNDTNMLANNYSNTTNNQEVFVKIFNVDNSLCYAITSFNLIVSQVPIANTVADVFLCDDATQNGQETINLSLFNDQVLNGQMASSFNITYHLTQDNANNNVGALPDVYQSSNETIFIRIENTTHVNCYDTSSFNITIDDYFAPNQPDNLFLCENDNDGVETFSLSSQDSTILLGSSGTYNVSYHLSQDDADSNTDAILGNYQNTTSFEEIFARIEKTTNVFCYQTLSFFIDVRPVPVINMQTDWIICSNETLTVSAPAGFDAYLWSTGETTSTIDITSPGNYTVTVTNNYATVPALSCSSSQSITVTESDEALINDVAIVDWTINENEIRVFVDGLGDYEYSLDGITYQDSNLFSGLNTGEYLVYVRDKLGCGVTLEEVFLLFYPYFFTPNNDTVNDFWQIKFSESEPDLKILIFDRYGKLLTPLDPRSRGWDGTFNGKLMPTSDYWFLVKRPSNGKEYRGHFTLRR